jgi:hypothetical protein
VRARRLVAVAAMCVAMNMLASGVGSADSGGTTTADTVVLAHEQLRSYQPDPADSITSSSGGDGSDLERVMAACFGSNTLLGEIEGGSDASIGDSFATGKYDGGFQRGVQTIAFVGDTLAAASTAYAVVADPAYSRCIDNGYLQVLRSIGHVGSTRATALHTPVIGNAATGFDLTFHFTAGTFSGFVSQSLTTVRVGSALAMLETFGLGNTASASTFPEADRVALLRRLAIRMTHALANPIPKASSSEPDLADCIVESNSIQGSASVTAASVTLEGDGAFTVKQSAADPDYSVDADVGLKPGVTAAFGGEGGELGLGADISAGLQFGAGVGYHGLYTTDLNDLMGALVGGTTSGSTRLTYPSYVDDSVGAWIEGDANAGVGSGEFSGSGSLGLRRELEGNAVSADDLYIDVTGEGGRDLGLALGGFSTAAGSSRNVDATVTLDMTPDFDPTGIGLDLVAEDTASSEVSGGKKSSALNLGAYAGDQNGFETAVAIDIPAVGKPVVVSAIDTLLEAVLDDDGTGPSDASIQTALATLARNASTEVTQSSLTKRTIGGEIKGGEVIAWGVKAEAPDVIKQLTDAAYADAGDTTLKAWTTCKAAALVGPGGSDSGLFGPVAGTFEGSTGASGGAILRADGVGYFDGPDNSACGGCSDATAPSGTIVFKFTDLQHTHSGYTATGTVTAVSDPDFAKLLGVRPGTSVTARVDSHGALSLSFLGAIDVLSRLPG